MGTASDRRSEGAAAAAGVRDGADSDVPFDVLLGRYERLLVGGAFDTADQAFGTARAALDAEAAELWRSLDTAVDRTALWPDLAPVSAAVNFGKCYGRLRTLAIAWATPGTVLSSREDLPQAIISALRFLRTHGYVLAGEEHGNWWHWEIGAPRALLDTCVLLRRHLPKDDLLADLATVDHFCPDADRRTKFTGDVETGANRADKAVIVALSGLLAHDADRVAAARDGLSDRRGGGRHSLFRRVASGDGFHEDGSFVQHDTVAYTGAYGTTLLSCLALLLALFDGSPWEVTDPGLSRFFDTVEDSFAPVLFDGRMMDAVRGRAVSRPRSRDDDIGAELIGAVLLLTTVAPAAYAERWRSSAKGWLQRMPAERFFERAPLARIGPASRLLADRSVRPAARPSSHHAFNGMARVVHHRPGWSAALALSSPDTAMFECGNGENLHGWYTGDGMLYMYLATDADQFSDSFWPTVDPYRLPGTTVDTRRRADVGRDSGAGTGALIGSSPFAGGQAFADGYGVAALDFRADGSTVRARKAWFFLDDAVVALGAAISAADGRTVETIVENRNLHLDGERRLVVDGAEVPPESGVVRRFAGTRWAHLDGVGGYLFPDGAELCVLRENRVGTWRSINIGGGTGGDDRPLRRHYCTLWLDHGVSPAEQSYGYVLLPGASAAETAAAAVSQLIRVPANTEGHQSIEVPGLALRASVDWTAAHTTDHHAEPDAAPLMSLEIR